MGKITNEKYNITVFVISLIIMVIFIISLIFISLQFTKKKSETFYKTVKEHKYLYKPDDLDEYAPFLNEYPMDIYPELIKQVNDPKNTEYDGYENPLLMQSDSINIIQDIFQNQTDDNDKVVIQQTNDIVEVDKKPDSIQPIVSSSPTEQQIHDTRPDQASLAENFMAQCRK